MTYHHVPPQPPPEPLPPIWNRISPRAKAITGIGAGLLVLGIVAGASQADTEPVGALPTTTPSTIDRPDTTTYEWDPGDDWSPGEDSTTTTTRPPATTTTAPPPVYAPPVQDQDQLVPDDLFVGFMRSQVPALVLWSDGEILALPYNACADLDRGTPVLEVVTGLLGEHPDDYQAAAFVFGAGVENYCSRHSAAVAAFNEQWS